MSDASWQEKLEWYYGRMDRHIESVKTFSKFIAAFYPEYVDLIELSEKHDSLKFEEPEFIPYVHIAWRYHMKDLGVEYMIPKNIDHTAATLHHVKNTKHHPEYWTNQMDVINPDNRDGVPSQIVDATKMPLLHVAEMMADWMAMSAEKDTSARDWYNKNVGVRWQFNDDQKKLMLGILDRFGY